MTLGSPLYRCLVTVTSLLVILAAHSEGLGFWISLWRRHVQAWGTGGSEASMPSALRCIWSRGSHAISAERRDFNQYLKAVAAGLLCGFLFGLFLLKIVLFYVYGILPACMSVHMWMQGLQRPEVLWSAAGVTASCELGAGSFESNLCPKPLFGFFKDRLKLNCVADDLEFLNTETRSQLSTITPGFFLLVG